MAFISTERVLSKLDGHLGREERAIETVASLLELIKETGIENNVGAGTTYINCATVYKAFGRAPSNEPEMHAYSVNDRIKDGNIRNLHVLYAV